MMCLVLLATLVPRAADAADWKRLFGDYEYVVSVDADSVERSNGYAKAWVRQHFLQERHSGDYAYNVLNGLNSFDCRNKKVNLLQVEVYQDDRAVDSYTPNASGGDRPIIPGTVEYFAYRYLCTPRKK
jgi:hypothetical protein